MTARIIMKKIPGELPRPFKKENQGYVEDLSKIQKFELEELLERQNKILSNKNFVLHLTDKGEKLSAFRDKIQRELDHRNELDEAANLLSKLNIASHGKAAMNELEWTGKYNESENVTKIVELDSDDEEDPLKILAQPTGTGVHKKKVINLPPEETLIKQEDLEEIESFKTEALPNVEHVKYIVNKVENSETVPKREPFKPYKTTKSNVHDPINEKERKYNKNWEVTAATPPHTVHGAAKILSINESLKLQKEQTEKLQIVQTKHAAERLAEQLGLHKLGTMPENVETYRTRQDIQDTSSSCNSDEEHEVHDDEDNDKAGTVVFTVDSVES